MAEPPAATDGLGLGAVKVISESGPMLTVKVPVSVSPPEEVNATEKVVVPCWAGVRVSIGSTVKVQLSPVCETEVSLVLSTPVASAQVTVKPVPSVRWSNALISTVRLRPTGMVGAVKVMSESGPR